MNEAQDIIYRIPRLALVVPCLNEEETLQSTAESLTTLLSGLISAGRIDYDSFIMFVDDGSTDGSWNIISSLADNYDNIRGIKLTANTGQQNAILAGLDEVFHCCDAALTIDADLQDDLCAVPEMIDAYASGCEVVYGVRDNRDSDTRWKRSTAMAYYKIAEWLGVRQIPNHSEFRLLSHEVISRLRFYGERNIYLRGLIPSIGFREHRVYYTRRPRAAGKTKYSLRRMMNLAADGITSFSIKPVRLVFAVGLIFLLIALGILLYVLIQHFNGRSTEGWSSIMLSIWFCSGIVLMSLGIIGEYIGKIYLEVKHRPRYTIDDRTHTTRK